MNLTRSIARRYAQVAVDLLRRLSRQSIDLSLPRSFQFCAGGAADISRRRQPPESPSLLPLTTAGARDRSAIQNYFVEFIHVQRPCRGAKNWSPGPVAAAPANIHRPFRAKSGNRKSRRFWVMTKTTGEHDPLRVGFQLRLPLIDHTSRVTGYAAIDGYTINRSP
jgi:hypothetical protein